MGISIRTNNSAISACRNPRKNSSSKAMKITLYIIALIAANLLVIYGTLKIIEYFEGPDEAERAVQFMNEISQQEEFSDKELAGMIFEYSGEYTFSDGEVRNIDSRETYYWNGKEFIPASDFMK
ncbi:MAG: hypothetical protein ACI4I9_10320 [Porcipelethomonas sp.]